MTNADPRNRTAYAGRESTSTRNPHTARAPLVTGKSAKQLAKLSLEERILAQWRAAHSSSVSDEAKTMFQIQALGNLYKLADVRLWTEHHRPTNGVKTPERGVIFLEFFFDGCTSELKGQEEVFKDAFEKMIEGQLQERRITEFREKLVARRRCNRGVGAVDRAADGDDGVDMARTEGGDSSGDLDWQAYLKRPIPATDLSIQSFRDAGCALSFLVVQTSISVSAGEVLGQIAFQEHFPIDGVAQEMSKSTKPLPRWVHGLLACTIGLSTITILAWWQVAKQLISGADGGASPISSLAAN